MRIRTIELSTADGLAPLPMHFSWVRHGILVVGMDNETHVYSQWRAPASVTAEPAASNSCDLETAAEGQVSDKRILTDLSLQRVASSSSMAMTALKDFRQSASALKMTQSVSNFNVGGVSGRKKAEGKLGGELKGQTVRSSDSRESDDGLHMAMLECGMFEAARYVP